MAAKPVKVAFLADTADLRSSLSKAEAAMDGAAATATKAGGKIDAAFESTAGHADDVASKGSQAAGALSGLGGLVGGQFGTSIVAGGIAMQAFADAGDLVNVVTESSIVKKAKDTAVTVAKATADKASAVASKAYAAAQWLVNAALEANPIGLVVVALVAITAALIVAYKKSDTFRKIVNAAFDSVRSVASGFAHFFTHVIPDAVTSVIDFVKSHWKVAAVIFGGPIAAAVLLVRAHIGEIKDAISGVVDWIKGLAGRFLNAGQTVGSAIINGIKRGLSAAAGVAGSIAGGVHDALVGVINGLIDRLNAAIPNSLGKGPISVNLPDNPIPHLAAGGIVTRPTVALIGEAGPEAVIPLNRKSAAGGPMDLRAVVAAIRTADQNNQVALHANSQEFSRAVSGTAGRVRRKASRS